MIFLNGDYLRNRTRCHGSLRLHGSPIYPHLSTSTSSFGPGACLFVCLFVYLFIYLKFAFIYQEGCTLKLMSFDAVPMLLNSFN